MSATLATSPTTVPPTGTVGTPAPLSLDLFLDRHAGDRVELVEGIVQELPMPTPKHGKLCAIIASRLLVFVESADLGHVMSNDSFVRTGPSTVRGADVCYYSYDRLPPGEVPAGLLPVAPDLVVEVRSPTDTWTDLFAKVAEYLRVGVRAVVVVDVESESVSIYRETVLQQILHRHDQLTLPEILPGFALPLDQLFR